MIDIKQFDKLQKQSKDSFSHQKQIMKKVMLGKSVLCSKCQQTLYLYTPEHCNNTESDIPGIRCKKGCTDLQLDFV